MVMRWNNEGDACYTTESGVAFVDQLVLARAVLGCTEGNTIDVKLYEGQAEDNERMITRLAFTTPAGIAMAAQPFELGFVASEGLYIKIEGTGAVTLIKGRK